MERNNISAFQYSFYDTSRPQIRRKASTDNSAVESQDRLIVAAMLNLASLQPTNCQKGRLTKVLSCGSLPPQHWPRRLAWTDSVVLALEFGVRSHGPAPRDSEKPNAFEEDDPIRANMLMQQPGSWREFG